MQCSAVQCSSMTKRCKRRDGGRRGAQAGGEIRAESGDKLPALASISRQPVGSPVGAPAALRTEKENGAETKSSAPFLALSAPKFAAIARAFRACKACKMTTMSGPVRTPPRVYNAGAASVHFGPSF